ncbi:hypothetical protein PENTCL1PPCAC_23494, partial [Pristionchus entomophagus]
AWCEAVEAGRSTLYVLTDSNSSIRPFEPAEMHCSTNAWRRFSCSGDGLSGSRPLMTRSSLSGSYSFVRSSSGRVTREAGQRKTRECAEWR